MTLNCLADYLLYFKYILQAGLLFVGVVSATLFLPYVFCFIVNAIKERKGGK